MRSTICGPDGRSASALTPCGATTCNLDITEGYSFGQRLDERWIAPDGLTRP